MSKYTLEERNKKTDELVLKHVDFVHARAIPDLAARTLLQSAAWFLRRYIRGRDKADEIEAFLAAHPPASGSGVGE